MEAHITLPKSTLMRFADTQSKKIAYCDLSTGGITECFPKHYHTATDYYPEEFENWLSGYVETEIGRLHAKIKEFEETQEGCCFDDESKMTIVKILTAQIVRTPDTVEQVMNTEEQNRLIDFLEQVNIEIGNVNQHTEAAVARLRHELETPEAKRRALYTKQHVDNLAKRIMRKQFCDYTVRLAIVDKDVTASFLLTPTHSFQAGKLIFIPVSPRYAYVLLPTKDNEKYVFDKQRRLQGFFGIEEGDLDCFVPFCVETARQFKGKHIIGSKQYLQKLVKSGLLQPDSTRDDVIN